MWNKENKEQTWNGFTYLLQQHCKFPVQLLLQEQPEKQITMWLPTLCITKEIYIPEVCIKHTEPIFKKPSTVWLRNWLPVSTKTSTLGEETDALNPVCGIVSNIAWSFFFHLFLFYYFGATHAVKMSLLGVTNI